MNREASTVCRKRSPIRPARSSSSRQTGTRSPTRPRSLPCHAKTSRDFGSFSLPCPGDGERWTTGQRLQQAKPDPDREDAIISVQ